MLKGRKMTYAERWKHDLRLVPIAMAGPAGDKLRTLRDEIRREHRTRKKDS